MINSEHASKLLDPPNAVVIEIRDIPERTARSAVVRTTNTAQKIARGKALIEAEIAQNEGIYPRATDVYHASPSLPPQLSFTS